jgi:uncharacterized protein
MPYLPRRIEPVIKKYLSIFPVVGVCGPRQSGKSTTLRHLLGKSHRYVTFDDPVVVEQFNSDPRGFMMQFDRRIVFDEVQKVPALFDYLKMAVDSHREDYGRFVVTGSNQFNLVRSITESLAGRIGLLSLLPFELRETPVACRSGHLLHGGYPELIIRRYESSREWYGAYLGNYIERDVRSLYNIGNLHDFQRLVMLLAARVSQELNMSLLARELGVSVKTVQSWISVLEAGHIVFLLHPYHRNLGKRLIKRPKVYFYDTGLVCYLVGIDREEALRRGPLDGPIFENYVVAEKKKGMLHEASHAELFFFRSNLGDECDLMIENRDADTLELVEIKSNATPKPSLAGPLKKLVGLAKVDSSLPVRKVHGRLVYRGEESGTFGPDVSYVNFRNFLSA